ncbi:ATP-binding protein [Rickettsiella endosymbiont of Miltochrista miniata]|uniref:ATP-binding protein n=1 Tax=Rickettsiella endosymbiont of Miltochrista miniata TaxID=3066239 RepID=UPI00313E2A20
MNFNQKKDGFDSAFVLELLKQLPVHVFWKDREGKYLGCNDLFARGLGLSSSEAVIGKTDYDLPVRKKDSDIYRKDDKEVMESRIPKLNIEEEQTFPDGRKGYLLTNKVPVFNKNNEVIGVIGVYSDITERKKSEEALKLAKDKAEVANQAKTEFLENMRHDIRTPLSGIVGCAHLIQMESNNPKKVAEYATDLAQSSDALLEFLNKILESIKVATGEIPILKQRFDLHKELEQIVRLNKPQADIKHINLYLDYDKSIPAYLLGDPLRFQRIVLELVTNAIKYTDKGEIKVSARLIKNKTHTGQLIIELRVRDTGMGIPRDKQTEVYTRFTRLVPAYRGIYPGTGLGLSVVKQFIDDLGGEIHIESDVGKGATFICLIPLQESLSTKDGNAIKEIQSFESDTYLIDKKVSMIPALQDSLVTTESRVLVVEDNLIAAKIAQGILSNFNCQIDIAPDGKTALTLIEKNHYGLILMDIGLSDADGCDITRLIRSKQWNNNSSIPIVGLTAHIDEENKRRCLEKGMNAIYIKPLTPEKASGILNAFLSLSQASIFKEHQTKSTNQLQSLSLLDKEKALEFLGSDEKLHEMLALLVNSLTKEIPNLEQYHQDNDWQGIQVLAHKWKGGASYCSASRLEQICIEMITALKAESLEEAEVFYQQLLQIAEATKEVARKVIGT